MAKTNKPNLKLVKVETMLAELVEKLLRTGREQAPAIIGSDILPEGQYYVRDTSGSLQLRTAEMLYRPEAENVADFIEVAAQYRSTLAEHNSAAIGPMIVFVGDVSVFAYFDVAGDRRHHVSWPLVQSDAFEKVQFLQENKPKMDHRTFLKMLRLSFWNAMPPGLYDNLREVRFTSAGDNASLKSAGKVSIGKSIAAELAGANRIPEIVTLDVDVFERADFTGNTQPIRFDLDIDPSECSFQLIPLNDELTRAKLAAQQKLQMNILQRMDQQKVEGICVIGSPS